MKAYMKKKWFALVAVFVVSAAAEAWALGPQGVSAGPHNLSTSSPSIQYQSDPDNEFAEDEVCIFCHTPHGGTLNGPLWNKALTGETFTHYNSTTLSAEVANTRGQNLYPESRLCMTCHDGTLSMYSVLNASNRTGGQPAANEMLDAGKMMGPISYDPPIDAVIGHGRLADGTVDDTTNVDLTDDHPVSFEYVPVKNDSTNAGALNDESYAEDQGIKFFGGSAYRVECSSCHDPHVDYDWDGDGTGDQAYQPFLRTSNAGSAMCLACHIK